MSQQLNRQPQQRNEDLLKLPFDFSQQKQSNFDTPSSSLSLSNSPSIVNRFSLNLPQRKSVINDKDINIALNHTLDNQNAQNHEERAMNTKIIQNEVQNSPSFERKFDTSIQRVRKSSFFEDEDFSWKDLNLQSFQSPQTRKYLKQNSVHLEQKTQGAKTPYFKGQNQKNEHPVISESWNMENKKSQQPSPGTSLQQPQNSFGEKQTLEKQEDERQQRLVGHQRQVICFKCGKNHYSNQCKEVEKQKSADIKCFNCKKNGHTARNCFQPRKCHNCGSTDHISHECPSVEAIIQQKVCHNCNQRGHFARQCKLPFKCFLCHQPGHQIKNCPRNKQNNPNRQIQRILQPRKCFNCKKDGHYANDCPEPQRCHDCGQQGHYSKDCPHYFPRPKSVNGNIREQDKVERMRSQQKPTSEPEVRKSKPFMRANYKKKSQKKINERIYKQKGSKTKLDEGNQKKVESKHF